MKPRLKQKKTLFFKSKSFAAIEATGTFFFKEIDTKCKTKFFQNGKAQPTAIKSPDDRHGGHLVHSTSV